MKVKHKIALGYIKTKLNFLSVVNKRKAGEEAFRLFCTPPTRSIGEEKPIFKQGETFTLRLNNKKIHGYRVNHPGTKKIVLLHGFTSTCQHFARFAEPLVDIGFEVLAFDAPAHGRSEGDTTHALEYAELIHLINEKFGPIDGYIAHSFGGISVALALENIPHSNNVKLVLIAPATETASAIDGAFAMIGIKNPILRKSIDDVILQMSGHITEWFSIRRAIKNIKAQVLWVHDEDDDITPLQDALKVKEDNLSHVNFMITKGLGHRRIYKEATIIQQIIDFFKVW